jgi:hypothetical protein
MDVRAVAYTPCTHERRQAQAHRPDTRTRMYVCTHRACLKHSEACLTHSGMYTCTYSCTHASVPHTLRHVHMYVHMYTHDRPLPHPFPSAAPSRTHVRTRVHMRACSTYIRACSTHSGLYTHTYMCTDASHTLRHKPCTRHVRVREGAVQTM